MPGANEEPRATILHVSDTQFGQYHRFDASDSLAGHLIRDVVGLAGIGVPPIDLIVISGDIAETGRKSEYDDAQRFVDALCGHTGLGYERVVVAHTLTGHTDWVRAVAYSPDGTQLATASHDGTVRIWDAASATHQHTLTGHTGWVWAVAYSPDGTHLATAGADGTVRITDLAALPRPRPRWHRVIPRRLRTRGRRSPLGPAIGEAGGGVTSLAYSPDGAIIAVARDDGTVSLISTDPAQPRPITRLIGLPDGGWAVLIGEHQYKLHGDPAGRFWWSSGLCRFEPGELDGYGVERI